MRARGIPMDVWSANRLEKRGRTVRGVAYAWGMRYDWPIRPAWTNGKCCIMTSSPEVVDGQLAFWFVFDFFLFLPYMSLVTWWNFIIDISGATLPVSEANIRYIKYAYSNQSINQSIDRMILHPIKPNAINQSINRTSALTYLQSLRNYCPTRHYTPFNFNKVLKRAWVK